MNVKILVTVNDLDLIDAATLVFDTIRVGFPESNIEIFNNGMFMDEHRISELAIKSQATVVPRCSLLHHQWVEMLVEREQEPFFICDTDVIFWKKFEIGRFWDKGKFNAPIAGRLIPAFYDKFTKAVTLPRLHTSLMYLDPVAIRADLKKHSDWIKPTRFNPIINPFYPVQIPAQTGDVFYDTCALLYLAVGGERFTESELDCYDHLHAGTWVKELAAAYPELSLPDKHRAIYKNPKLAKGIWRQQDDFYKLYAPTSRN